MWQGEVVTWQAEVLTWQSAAGRGKLDRLRAPRHPSMARHHLVQHPIGAEDDERVRQRRHLPPAAPETRGNTW